MRVHLITRDTIIEYAKSYATSRASFKTWLQLLSIADWRTPDDILESYPSADLLGNGSERVVFNIGGNKFRMICAYYFGITHVHLYVKWIGTHAEYSKLLESQEQYTISQF